MAAVERVDVLPVPELGVWSARCAYHVADDVSSPYEFYFQVNFPLDADEKDVRASFEKEGGIGHARALFLGHFNYKSGATH